jgi:hypothetical protein
LVRLQISAIVKGGGGGGTQHSMSVFLLKLAPETVLHSLNNMEQD